jgi:hypothetical protein
VTWLERGSPRGLPNPSASFVLHKRLLGVEVVPHLFPPLAVLESVRCLECGDVYAKPAAGDTVMRNPGCPGCGYSGWIPITLPPERVSRLRSAAGRPLLQLVRTR